jgi:hypothetical protein
MEIYRDNTVTTIITDPYELGKLLVDMIRAEKFPEHYEPGVNPVIQVHHTETKTHGCATVCFKLRRQPAEGGK